MTFLPPIKFVAFSVAMAAGESTFVDKVEEVVTTAIELNETETKQPGSEPPQAYEEPVESPSAQIDTSNVDPNTLFWIYHNGRTLGPMSVEKLKLQYMIGNISKKIFIAPFMNGRLDLKWDEVNLPRLINKSILKDEAYETGGHDAEEEVAAKCQLSYVYITIYLIIYLPIKCQHQSKREKDLEEYQRKCAYLKNELKGWSTNYSEIGSLFKELDPEETYLVQPPDIDQILGGYKSLTLGGKISFFAGKILTYFANFIGLSHIVPSLFIVCFFYCFTWMCQCSRDCLSVMFTTHKWLNLYMSLSFFIVPPLIVYFCFIYSGVYDEIQSWHIFYIAWGSSIGIFCLIHSTMDRKKQREFDKFLWSIIGVEANDTGKGYDDPSWFIVACLPAVVAGFIANYILEEKFLLECNNETGDICFEDGRGCCVVISSHDISNFYDFMGGLFSNILAAYAFIRICGWILALGDLELRAYAKKQK